MRNVPLLHVVPVETALCHRSSVRSHHEMPWLYSTLQLGSTNTVSLLPNQTVV
jgi:hypothetical protein